MLLFHFASPPHTGLKNNKKKDAKEYPTRVGLTHLRSIWDDSVFPDLQREPFPPPLLHLGNLKSPRSVQKSVSQGSDTLRPSRDKIFQGLCPGSKKPRFPLIASIRDITKEPRGEERSRGWQPSVHCQVHWTPKARLERSWNSGSDRAHSLCKSTIVGPTESTASHWHAALQASQCGKPQGKLFAIMSSFGGRESLRWLH